MIPGKLHIDLYLLTFLIPQELTTDIFSSKLKWKTGGYGQKRGSSDAVAALLTKKYVLEYLTGLSAIDFNQ